MPTGSACAGVVTALPCTSCATPDEPACWSAPGAASGDGCCGCCGCGCGGLGGEHGGVPPLLLRLAGLHLSIARLVLGLHLAEALLVMMVVAREVILKVGDAYVLLVAHVAIEARIRTVHRVSDVLLTRHGCLTLFARRVVLGGNNLARHRPTALCRSGSLVIVLGRQTKPEEAVLRGQTHRLDDATGAPPEGCPVPRPPHLPQQAKTTVPLGKRLTDRLLRSGGRVE